MLWKMRGLCEKWAMEMGIGVQRCLRIVVDDCDCSKKKEVKMEVVMKMKMGI